MLELHGWLYVLLLTKFKAYFLNKLRDFLMKIIFLQHPPFDSQAFVEHEHLFKSQM